MDPSGGKETLSNTGTEKTLLGLLLVMALVRGLLYAAIVPPWQAPDETGHFEYAWLLVQRGHIPTVDDLSPAFEQKQLASLYEWHYDEFIGFFRLPAGMPARLQDLPQSIFASGARTVFRGRFSLAYLWQALFLLPVYHQDLVLQLYVVRFSSVLLGVGTVWLAWKTFRELLPCSASLAAAMTALVVFLPQHTFISSAVGDGPLAELAAGLVFYAWARLFRHGIGVGEILGILLGTVVGLWSKPTTLFLLPFNVMALAMGLYHRRQQSWDWRHVAYLLGIFVVLFGIGWLAVRGPVWRPVEWLLKRFWTGAQPNPVDRQGMSLGKALVWTYQSFWARFGWWNLPVSPGWYVAIYAASLAALAGWTVPGRKTHPWWAVGLMVIAWLLAVLVMAAYFVYQLFIPGAVISPQGRYLFAAIVPFAFLFVGGWARLFPLRVRPFVGTAVVVGMVWFDAVCLLYYIVPFYYG
jgi:hypothetical protein